MEANWMYYALILVALVGVIGMVIILARLYVRASKKKAFVKTGLGGEKVIKDAGAVVLPIFHETIPVNMETLKIEIIKENDEGLITKDKQLIDVKADFFVKVKADAENISRAAQTLGDKLTDEKRLKAFIESKFVDSLRSVAATMDMESLHVKRTEFVQEVQKTVAEDLIENGLVLESVSLKSLDQTDLSFYKENNVFNAEGLAKTTEIIQLKKEEKNKILQDTEVAISRKNMEAEKEQLNIKKEQAYNKLEQEKEIEIRKASQESLIKIEKVNKDWEANQVKIKSEEDTEIAKAAASEAITRKQIEMQKQVQESEIVKQRAVEKAQIEKERDLQESEIVKQRAVELAKIEKEKDLQESEIVKQRAVELAKIEKERALQETLIESEKVLETSALKKSIEIAEKQKEESEAKAEAEKARKLYVKESEDLITVKELAVTEREKQKHIIKAHQDAEIKSIELTVKAKAEKDAQKDKAEGMRIESEANAQRITIVSEAEKNAELNKIEVLERKYAVEAEGKKNLHDADNALSEKQINLKLRLALIEKLPEIIMASVEPVKAIKEIKIMQVDSLRGSVGVEGQEKSTVANKNMFEQAKEAALGYQVEKPLIGKILKEFGIQDLASAPSDLLDLGGGLEAGESSKGRKKKTDAENA